MRGCASSVSAYTLGGFVQCRKRPHDFTTTEQRSIVDWLKQPGRNAMTDAGCPGHQGQAETVQVVSTCICEPWCKLLGPHEACVTRTTETNPKGNTCDCGSSAEHKCAPGCTPRRSEWRKVLDEPCATCGAPRREHADTKHAFAAVPVPPPTPAAMLGEALEHVKRACSVLTRHGHVGLMFNASILAEQVDAAKREAEAREATAKGMDMFGRLAKGLGTPSAHGAYHMPLPVTVAEARARGLTYASQGTSNGRGIDRRGVDGPGISAGDCRGVMAAGEGQAVAPETCWTTIIGAPTHNLGELPEKCYTCAAKRAEGRAKAPVCRKCDLSEYGATCTCNPPRDPSPGVG